MNSLKNVVVIGLTGQSGSGKTTVCDIFKNNGFAIINADNVAREVTRKGTACLKNIFDVFPECIDEKTEELDRAKMAKIVFGDRDLLKLYNSIIYPYITTKILERIRELGENGQNTILLDAPTLFESRVDDFCNYIVSVISNQETRFNRIKNRDKISDEAIMQRFNSQHDDEFYLSRSDMIIKNDFDLLSLEQETLNVVSTIKELFNA